ncbi:MAG TPA: toxin-antitoxin system HicB family antitoxin, partial [Pirellulales bacterium]|nr:toxin-antitoxin system HicB family antitoxin [Pirellulales bacterium]
SLREREKALPPKEATKVITIRLPESLHDALTTEAHERRTSVNKLCISKLLKLVEEELVPNKKKKPSPAREREKQAIEK